MISSSSSPTLFRKTFKIETILDGVYNFGIVDKETGKFVFDQDHTPAILTIREHPLAPSSMLVWFKHHNYPVIRLTIGDHLVPHVYFDSAGYGQMTKSDFNACLVPNRLITITCTDRAHMHEV